MKKRTLLVSTAILLVAVMALATASFAWFAAGSGATANGMQVTVSAGSYLKIRFNGTGTFTYTASAGMSEAAKLGAATSKNSQTFFIYTDPSAIEPDASGAITDNTTTDLSESTAETARIMKSFQLKNAGGSAIPVKAVVTMPAPASGTEVLRSLRVGLVVKDGSNNVENYYVYANTGYNTTKVGSTISAGTVTLEAPVYTTSGTTVIGSMEASASQTEFDSTNDKTVEIYIWFEGQDAANTGRYASALEEAAQNISVVFSKAGD